MKSSLAFLPVILLFAVITGIPGDTRSHEADSGMRPNLALAVDAESNPRLAPDERRLVTGADHGPALHPQPVDLREMAVGKTGDSGLDGIPDHFENAGHRAAAGNSRSLHLGAGSSGSPVVALGGGGMATQAEIDALSAGLEQAMTSIQGNLVARVFGDTLPLLGNHLAAEPIPGVPARHYLTAVKTAINSGLATLTGSPAYTKIQVESAVNSALTSAGITFSLVSLDASNATDLKLSMNTSKAYPAFATPLDPALGLPGLGLQILANDPDAVSDAQVALNYSLNLSVGVDAQGFYLNTANNASSLTTGFDVTLPALDVKAKVSKLRFHLVDESAADGDGVPATLFNGSFAVDLLDPSGADNRLRTSELGGVLLSATLTGNAALNLNLTSDLESAALPEITTDLNIAWGFTNAVVDPAVGISSFGNLPTVAFKKVSIGLASFFGSFVDPMFSGVQTLTDPVQPVVDLLTTEVGFLSELAGEKVTLIDLASGSGAVDPDTAARLDLAASLVSLINSPHNGGIARIDLGDFSIGSQDPRSAGFLLENVVPLSTRSPAPPASQNAELASFLSAKSNLPGGGMTFNLIEDPSAAINLLFGRQVDFFTYHVPSLDVVGTGYDQFFPIFGPFGARLTATIEAHAYLDIGYDSSGLARFAASGNEDDIFDGFYVVDQSGPEAVFSATLKAAAAANILIAELGVGGGITGSLLVDLADNDFNPSDGRVHLGELSDSCIFDLTGQISAGLFAYLEIGIGPFSETFEKDFGSLVLLSFDLSSCDEPGMPGVILAHNTGPNVALHVGLDASLRQVGSLVDGAEDFGVNHISGALGGEVVAIQGTGLLTMAGAPLPPQDYTVGANGDITASGGEFDDRLTLAPDVLSPANLHGGTGDDRLVGGAGDDTLNGDVGHDVLVGGDGADHINGGADQDFLDGQDGDDELHGGSGADILLGGPGADILDGGTGFDAASYASATVGVIVNLALGTGSNDAQGDTYISIERIVGSPHADILIGSAGADNFDGGDGNDTLDGNDGDDLLVGGAGADTLIGGPGNDFAAYSLSPAGVSVSLLTGVGSGGDAAGDTLAGIENLHGSDYADTLEGDNGPNWLRGLNGNNTLRGNGGDDQLEGGKNDDQLEGGSGNDTLRASMDVSSLDPTVSGGNDTLLGGPGDDILYGDAGGDTLDGGDDNDQIFGGKDNDQIFGGNGNDTISGGSGSDTINAGDGTNVINGDAGGDILISGSGADNIHGGTEDDTVSSGAGDDLVFGEDGNDSLDAGEGSDRVDGGAGNDFLSVGTLRGPTQDPNRLDHLFGGAGFDAITADFSNQTVPISITVGPTQSLVFADGTEARDFENVHDLFTGSGPYDDVLHLDGTADDGFGNFLKTGGGNDVIFSGRGSDNVDAGDGDDFVNGGDNDTVLVFGSFGTVIGFTGQGETLAGGAGNDTISFQDLHKRNSGSYYGVAVNLGTNATDGSARGVTISGFENIIGTEYGDSLTGDDGPNIFRPLHGGGNSTTLGSSGPDRIDGKGGIDTVILDFSREELPDSTGISSNPGSSGSESSYVRQTPSSPFYWQDAVMIQGVEKFQITGTSKNDQITGGILDSDDILSGLGGDDTLGGYGGNDVLLGGEGNDTLTGQGATFVQFIGVAGGHDVFDGGPGDDQIDDIALNGSTTLLRADALFQLDGGPGFDTLSVDFSNHPEAVVWSSAAPHDITFPDGAYARNFEKIRNFASGAGNDSITQLGRVDNIINTGGGDDRVAPGLGVDTVDGGNGSNDLLILDYSVGDLPTYGGLTGGGNQNVFRRNGTDSAFLDYLSFANFERMDVVGTSHADTIYDFPGDDLISGGAGDDTITSQFGGNNTFNGGDGNDILTGGAGIDVLIGSTGHGAAGANEVDRLRGGGGADVFVLGDADRRFYDDQSPSTPGLGAYASIEDFTPSQGDHLRLFGSASQYLLGPSPISGTPGTALYYDSNGNTFLDPASDELIAILASPVTLAPANTIATATFTQILDPALVGLGSIQPAVTDDGTGPRFKLQFSIVDPMPAGMFLEIQASTDLGVNDPWLTVASKTGSGSWLGPANVSIAVPSGGKIVITVSALQPVATVRRQFFRFRLSSL